MINEPRRRNHILREPKLFLFPSVLADYQLRCNGYVKKQRRRHCLNELTSFLRHIHLKSSPKLFLDAILYVKNNFRNRKNKRIVKMKFMRCFSNFIAISEIIVNYLT